MPWPRLGLALPFGFCAMRVSLLVYKFRELYDVNVLYRVVFLSNLGIIKGLQERSFLD